MAIRKRSGSGGRRRASGRGGLLLACSTILAAALIIGRPQNHPESAAPASVTVSAYDTVDLAVPLEPVPIGTKIKDIAFERVPFPRHQVPPDAVRDLTPYMDGVVAAPLPARLPLFASNIRRTMTASNAVIDRIPSGMRAMTVRVDATTAVEGWAGSGAIVDVLLLEAEQTSVVAEKVKILSAERSVDPTTGQSTPDIPTTVTLLVSQEQCLAINTALNLGRIAFALRRGDDLGYWKRATYDSRALREDSGGTQKTTSVSGFVKVGDSDDDTFALTNGRWIKTDVKPEGFFAAATEVNASRSTKTPQRERPTADQPGDSSDAER